MNITRKLSNIIRMFIVTFCVAVTGSVCASDELQVVTEHWEPFNFKNQQGEIVGTSTEWVKSVLAKADVSYQLSLMPWQRAYNLAKSRKNIVIYSMFRSTAREHLFHWVCPLPNAPIHKIYKLRSRKDIDVEVNSDLRNYTINVVRGAYTHDYLLSLGLRDKLRLAASNSTNLPLLLNGRVDLITDFDDAIYPALEKKGLSADHIEVVHEFNTEPRLCMAISKGTPQHLIDKLVNAHQALSEEKAQ